MSLGINLLAELCKRASAILGSAYDVEIVEQHHHNKLDAPSGTALMLADAINEENNGAYHYVYDRSSVRAKRDPKEIGISSVRGCSIGGETTSCFFCGPDEVITLKHTAYSRSVFAQWRCERSSVSGEKGTWPVQYERLDCRTLRNGRSLQWQAFSAQGAGLVFDGQAYGRACRAVDKNPHESIALNTDKIV